MPGSSDSSAGSDADFPGSDSGDNPGSESNGQTAGAASNTDGQSDGSGDAEPGFGDGNGSESVPDLSDEPAQAGTASGSGDNAGQSGTTPSTGGGYSVGSFPGGQSGSSNSGGYGAAGNSGTAGQSGSGQGPLTPAEQVAILDAQLEQGTGDFDAMILEAEAEQRRNTREQAPVKSPSSGGETTDSTGDSPYGGGTASGGGYGGGIGGPSGGSGVPQNTAKYPPPADIPNGNDDDVVARQLREAAMRESDPAVREKLWNEYRKYKGIE